MPNPQWGQLIKQYRLRFGLTQQALANRLGISQKTVSRWESGEHMPRQEQQHLLRDLFRKPLNHEAVILMAAVHNCPALRALARHDGLRLMALSPPVIARYPERINWIGHSIIANKAGVLAEMLDDTTLERSIRKGEIACINAVTQGNFKSQSYEKTAYYNTAISFYWFDGTLYRDAVSVPLESERPMGYEPVFFDELVTNVFSAS